jgi:hypothetical protein
MLIMLTLIMLTLIMLIMLMLIMLIMLMLMLIMFIAGVVAKAEHRRSERIFFAKRENYEHAMGSNVDTYVPRIGVDANTNGEMAPPFHCLNLA